MKYQELVKRILNQGAERGDRTGTGVKELFGERLHYDLAEGFPLLTEKDMTSTFPKIVTELQWFMRGYTNIKFLVDRNVNIWNRDAYRWFRNRVCDIPNHVTPYKALTYPQFIDKIKNDLEFAAEFGDLGKIYGHQWRNFGGRKRDVPLFEGIEDAEVMGVDQVRNVINKINNDPLSRRILWSGWNPSQQDEMALPPCHVLYQFYVENDGRLSVQMYQRSADVFLGLPFNLASTALIVHQLAAICGLEVGEMYVVIGCAHIYKNHLPQAEELARRTPPKLPKLVIREGIDYTDPSQFTAEDFSLEEYNPLGELRGKISVGE